jgi:uncharacterized zinc-type alcohol dehydrogenase-like protein
MIIKLFSNQFLLMNSYKLTKYESKLNSTNDPVKSKFYKKKIDYYTNLTGGSLSQPKPVDSFDVDYSNLQYNENIPVLGFGTINDSRKFHFLGFERRIPRESDVVVQILYCGVCHSDWHYINGDWEPMYPLIPGHEICGKILKRDSQGHFNIGDIVGVGPCISSCKQCKPCEIGKVQYCENGMSEVYNGFDRYPGQIELSKVRTYGGFSTVIVVDSDYVFKIPDNIKPEEAAPLLCAGITVYSPIKQFNLKPRHKVAVHGVGGLGHMAIKFAKALGAQVYAITRTEWKKTDCVERLGCIDSISADQYEDYASFFDLIISTVPYQYDINEDLKMLNLDGTLWLLGAFDDLEFELGNLAGMNRIMRSSVTGGIPEYLEMFAFCGKHDIKPDIEIIDVDYIPKTFSQMKNSNVKYRYVIDVINTMKI